MLSAELVAVAAMRGRLEPVSPAQASLLAQALADSTLQHRSGVQSWRPWGECWRMLGGWAGLSAVWDAEAASHPEGSHFRWLADWAMTLDVVSMLAADVDAAEPFVTAGVSEPSLLQTSRLLPPDEGAALTVESVSQAWGEGVLLSWVAEVRDAVFEGRVRDAQAQLDGWHALALAGLDAAALGCAIDGDEITADVIGASADGVLARRRQLRASVESAAVRAA